MLHSLRWCWWWWWWWRHVESCCARECHVTKPSPSERAAPGAVTNKPVSASSWSTVNVAFAIRAKVAHGSWTLMSTVTSTPRMSI
jgi:hypothetical protein